MRSIFMGLSCALRRLEHAAAHLVALERLEQRLEVAFAEAVVALALDELEEHRAEQRCSREDLQQQARLAACGGAVEQDAARLQLAAPARRGRAGALRASRSRSSGGAVISGTPASAALSTLASRSSVSSAMCWMPSPLNFIRNSSIWPAPFDDSSFSGMRILPSGAVIALRGQAGVFALDVEVADLAEVEEALVEAGPVAPCGRGRRCASGGRSSFRPWPRGWRSTPSMNSKSMS